MNVVKMYSVYDVKAEIFSSPHFMGSDGVAIRSFSTACEDENSQFYKYPTDFSLYVVGEFNIETGEISPLKPKQICNASEFTPKKATVEEISNFATKEIQKLDEITQ
jgi:hypothetical protein